MKEEMEKILRKNALNRPTLCKSCEGIMVYCGLGEYRCEECGLTEFDDYGKVRDYLEHHHGANVAEISDATGVTHKSIRDMIKENRFEVIDNRGGYLRCELCGTNINSGRLCHECELLFHRKVEAEARNERLRGRNKYMSGFGENTRVDKGTKRFTRER